MAGLDPSRENQLATSLAQSICQTNRFRISEPRATLTSKIISVILPAIVLSLLAIPAVRDSDIAFFILANILMAVGMGGGMIMLAIITCKYFHARFNVHSWNVRYYTSSHGTQLTDGEALPQLRPVETQFFDRWLVIRFSIGFLAMSAFQVVIILFSVRAARTSKEASTRTGPDLSIEKLRRRFKKKEVTAHELVNRRGAGGGGRGSGKTLSHQTDTLPPSSVGDSAEIAGMGDEADSDPETGTRGQRAPWPEPPDPVRTRWS
ncbi:unnamed protein product [Parascedosporium putredinis]|uniref:Uncharacterized protein n=1 Tax=Parascedosporium putredinis TaxID=1442378 RepID=A0A9P1M5W7_9PEZI|nr:unnamed protein product [Parascedosporium putredinis]CAI7987745.1 unnamed protein product [Parascedosporium putredinis]